MAGITIASPPTSVVPCRTNPHISKRNIVVSTSLDPNPTPTESGNGSEAISVHDQVLQVELSGSEPIASLRGHFNGMDNKSGPTIKELTREEKRRAKVDDDSSSSFDGRREEEKDIEKGIRPSAEDEDTSKEKSAIEILRKVELVVPVMGFSIAIFFSLMTFHNIKNMKRGMQILIHLLPFSFAAFFSGIVLQYKYPKMSDIIKLVGYGFFCSAVFGLMAFYLTYYGTAITILFAIITNILLILTFFKKF